MSEGIGKLLDDQLVAQLEASNPTPYRRQGDRKSTTLFAYQRRVDIVLSPTNAESVRFYPAEASDLQILWQRPSRLAMRLKQSVTGFHEQPTFYPAPSDQSTAGVMAGL